MFKNFSFKKQPKAPIVTKIFTKPVVIALVGGLGGLLLGKLARKLTAPANPPKMAVVIIDKKNPCDDCTEECDSRIPPEGTTEGSTEGTPSEQLAKVLLERALQGEQFEKAGSPAPDVVAPNGYTAKQAVDELFGTALKTVGSVLNAVRVDAEEHAADSAARTTPPAEAEVSSPEPDKGTEERNQSNTNGNAHGNGRKHRDK